MLETRYPELQFLLQCLSSEKKREVPCEGELKGLDLEGVETVYIYGCGLGHHIKYFAKWLEEDSLRDLVFIEDDIEALQAFIDANCYPKLFDNPQVHLRFCMDPNRLEAFATECAETHPSGKIAIYAIETYKKKSRFRRLKDLLYRKTVVEHVILLDEMFHHLLFENLLSNYLRLPKSFMADKLKGAFKDTPAIICGAGPSLNKAIPIIKTQREKALILAGGSGITALTKQGIMPHFGMAIDPNQEEYERLKEIHAPNMPLLYGSRVLPSIFQFITGPTGYMQTLTGGPSEAYLEKELGMEPNFIGVGFTQEALSVTTLCIAYANFLGCNPILLSGLDLAYTDGASYAKGVVQDEAVQIAHLKKDKSVREKLLRRKNVHTTMKWIMESDAISHYAKQYPETRFINVTEGGIGFKDISYCDLSEIYGSFPTIKMNFDEKIQKLIEGAKMTLDVMPPLEKMHESLKRCDEIVNELQSCSKGKKIVLEMDLKEELAYELFLEKLIKRAHQTVLKPFRHSSDQTDKALCEHLKTVLSHYLTTFEQKRR